MTFVLCIVLQEYSVRKMCAGIQRKFPCMSVLSAEHKQSLEVYFSAYISVAVTDPISGRIQPAHHTIVYDTP